MRRRHYSGSDFSRAVTIEDLRQIARRRLPDFALEYMEGGGEGELSLAWNRDVFKTMRFVPHWLVDTTKRSVRTTLFGEEVASPLIVAPTGHNNLFRRDGDLALARAAAAEGVPFTLSTMSNTRLERIPQEAGGRLWMQLYVLGTETALMKDIVRRADEAGYQALVFTVDVNVYGLREWDRRQFRMPGRLTWRSLFDVALHPRWVRDVMVPNGMPRLANLAEFFPAHADTARAEFAHVRQVMAPDITWETLAELRRLWPRKLLVKGILGVPDARRAAEAGCDGVVLSNHGGRHMDSCVSPMEVLPEVVTELGKQLTIIVDSGFRRGSDVIKALALGAHAVMIGRASLYGLAAGGEAGARHAIGILNQEIDRVLGQIGCNSLAELGPHVLRTNQAMPHTNPLADLY